MIQQEEMDCRAGFTTSHVDVEKIPELRPPGVSRQCVLTRPLIDQADWLGVTVTTNLYWVFVTEVLPAVADRHPGPSSQHPGVAKLPSPLHLLSALLGLHHRPVEPAHGGDTGGLAVLALPVVLRQRQEVGTTYLNYYAKSSQWSQYKRI